MRQKDREHRELSMRINDFKNIKTEFRNNIDALKQVIRHIEEAKDLAKLKITE